MCTKTLLLLLTLLHSSPRVQSDKSYHSNNTSTNHLTASKPCDQTASTRHMILAAFSVTVLLIGIIGNLVSIIVIQTSRNLRTQIAYLFVTSLAVADLGVSIFVTTFKVDLYSKNASFCHGFGVCVFLIITDSLFPMVSISHLVIIAIDRWYAVACPFTYVSDMTKTRARCIVGAVWGYSLVWTLLGMFAWESPSMLAYKISTVGLQRYCYSRNPYYIITTVCAIYILPMSATTILYVIVLIIATKQAAAISKLHVSVKKIRHKRLNIETKAAKTVGAVFLAYVACWLPHFSVVLINYWTPEMLSEFYHKSPTTYDVVTTIISNVLPPINSMINPFLYFILGSQFRTSFKYLYCKLLNKPRHAHAPERDYSPCLTHVQNDSCANSPACLMLRNKDFGDGVNGCNANSPSCLMLRNNEFKDGVDKARRCDVMRRGSSESEGSGDL